MALFLGLVLAWGPLEMAWAQTAPDVAQLHGKLDIVQAVRSEKIDADRQRLELSIDPARAPIVLDLDATGLARNHFWHLVVLKNSATESRTVILSLPDQQFAGSRVLWPRPAGPRTGAIVSSLPEAIIPIAATGIVARTLAIPARGGVILALESASPAMPQFSLWPAPAFQSAQASADFSHGAILGLAAFLAFVMLALYTIRRHWAFPAGFAFGMAGLAFLANEQGYLDFANNTDTGPQFLRLFVETGLLAALTVWFACAMELPRRMPGLSRIVLGLAAACLLALPLGLVNTSLATGLVRLLFAGVVVWGGIYALLGIRRDDGSAQAMISVWIALALWTMIAALSALTPPELVDTEPLLQSLLVVVLLTMAFALARLAFNQGLTSRRFQNEAGRRALALAGAQHYVWDHVPKTEMMHIGEELERALGTRPGFFAEAGIDGWLELVHPSDRVSWCAMVAAADRRGRGFFNQQFRLQQHDGTWRWFELRGRVVATRERGHNRLIGTLCDVTTARRAMDRLLNDAVYDRSTGLPNRALLQDRLDQTIAGGEAWKLDGLHVLIIDVDRFKTLNEGLGHDAGDQLLRVIGRRLQALAGPDDTVARLPGAQFAFLAMGSGGDRPIETLVDEIRRAMARALSDGIHEVFVTATVGVSRYRGHDQAATDLLREAAIALYEGKRAGKAAEYYSATLRDDRSELVVVETALRHALERNEIVLHYQPIARLDDMALAGFEALVRWNHPERGVLPPAEFIPIAESAGLMRELGSHVLAEATRQLGIWQRAFPQGAPLFVAINYSFTQLVTPGLAEEVRQALLRESLRSSTFKIEVTETAMLENPELAVHTLEKLRGMGVGLACDDFGTGYSSLANLQNLPFDTLKLDRSFLDQEQTEGHPRARIVLEAVIRLAAELGLATVAEGIESQEQIDRLGAMGCSYGQGFFIGQPMTARQVTDALGGMPYTTARPAAIITALKTRATVIETRPPPEAGDAINDLAAMGAMEDSGLQSDTADDFPVRAPANLAPRFLAGTVPDNSMAEAPVPGAAIPEVQAVAPPVAGLAPMAPRRPRPVSECGSTMPVNTQAMIMEDGVVHQGADIMARALDLPSSAGDAHKGAETGRNHDPQQPAPAEGGASASAPKLDPKTSPKKGPGETTGKGRRKPRGSGVSRLE